MKEREIIQHRQIDGLTIFLNTVDYRTPHVHPEWELLWVLDQPLSVTCEQSKFVMQEGELVLFSPNTPHEFHKADKSCTFLCIQIAPKLFPTVQQVVDARSLKEHLNSVQLDELKRMMADLAAAYFQSKKHHELYCFGMAGMILHMLLTNLPSHELTPEETASIDRRNARLNRLIRFVDENYMHKIRLSDFAEAEHCSMSYLSHFIKDATNMTFQEYVNSVRFNCACKLIAGGQKKMLEVCMDSGFSDYRYFVRTFRQQYGMTPEEYRRHSRQSRLENAVVRHSLHSLERIYPKSESLKILNQFIH